MLRRRSLQHSTQLDALLPEALEHTACLRQFAEQARTERDERLTSDLIAEYGRYVESLEAAEAFWLEVLQNSLEATSRGGGPEGVRPSRHCPRLGNVRLGISGPPWLQSLRDYPRFVSSAREGRPNFPRALDASR